MTVTPEQLMDAGLPAGWDGPGVPSYATMVADVAAGLVSDWATGAPVPVVDDDGFYEAINPYWTWRIPAVGGVVTVELRFANGLYDEPRPAGHVDVVDVGDMVAHALTMSGHQ